MPSDPTEPTGLGLREARKLIARRKLSPVELTDAVLDRIERLNPKLNAFLSVSAESARQAAKRAESAARRASPGGMLGLPVSVKDLILTKDAPTTGGSKVFGAGLPAGDDAPVVARLRRAGAVIVGKTNLHEMAFGVTTVNEHFGAALNPWDLTRVAGGSSGGSAVAVAAGMGAGSLGTDTRGSIRIPASCCGIVGLKPTQGLLPIDGIVPLAPTLDHVGPMTRSVEDAALLLGAMRGSATWTERYLQAVDRKPRRLRLGVVPEFLRDLDQDVAGAIEAAIGGLMRMGWPAEEVLLPELAGALEASRVIVLAEAVAFHDRWLRERTGDYGPQVRSRLEGGYALSAVDYVRAREAEVVLTAAMARVFERVDLLVGATLPVPAAALEDTSVLLGGKPVSLSEAYCGFTAPQNLTGLPALSVPVGLTRSGLPVGLQLIGVAGAEETLLAGGRAVERLTAAVQAPFAL